MREKAASILDKAFFILGIIYSLYILSTVIELFQDPSEHYTTFFLGIAILTGLLTIKDILNKPIKGFNFWGRLVFFGIASAVTVFVAAYLRYNALRMTEIQPFFEPVDISIGWLMIISLLIINWYHWGTILNVMIGLAIAYVFWGHLISSPVLNHMEFSTAFSMSYMGLDTVAGIFWFVPLAADKIYFLIIFAAMLIGIGMLPLVVELGKWVGSHIKGGAAFPAIVGSALTGCVMGQAVSNTMLTGQLTIPMMKKHGFKPDFAGAVESVASTSGQFLPPILGLAAFIIAAFLNIAYIQVALAATLPAFLFVGGVVIAILIYASAQNLGYMTTLVDKKLILRLSPTFVASFTIVLVLLLLYYSPNIAALAGIGVMIIFSFAQGERRPNFRSFMISFKNGLEVVTILCLLLLAIGPIAQMATTTNLAGKLSSMLTGLVPHNLLLILIGTMIVSLVLGMGLPTPVAYLVVALTVAPFLQEMGVPALYAHLFCFYFAVFSTISPPVAISCLAAAKLSGGTFFGTARESIKIALPTFLIPYVFIYNPDLLVFPRLTWAGIWDFVSTLLCMLFFSLGLFGYCMKPLNQIERLATLAVAFLGMWYLFVQTLPLLIVFLVSGVVLMLWFRHAKAKQKVAKATVLSK